jgi:hypothetical protein
MDKLSNVIANIAGKNLFELGIIGPGINLGIISLPQNREFEKIDYARTIPL